MRRLLFPLALLLLALPLSFVASADKAAYRKDIPEGFTSLFNGKDLTGWKVNEGGKMEVWARTTAFSTSRVRGAAGC